MERSLGRLIKEYMTGAFVAFGIVLLASEALGAYFDWAGLGVGSIGRDLLGLFIILHLVGGSVGGYLVGGRTRKDAIRAGATTGLFAYLLEFTHNLIFSGAFHGSLYAALGFFFGGALGASYAGYQTAKTMIAARQRRREDGSQSHQ